MSKRNLTSSTVANVAKKAKKLPAKWAEFRTGDDRTVVKGPASSVKSYAGKPPKRLANGRLQFADFKDFEPILTPKEIIESGAFGGCYFRPITSGVCDGQEFAQQHLEFDFFSDVPDKLLCLPEYDATINKHKVTCGGSLAMWESKGWVSPQDPYGWFQWYCRFYQGRRSNDDARQIGRWQRCCGVTGRWRHNLINKVVKANTTYDDVSVSPVVRQTLLHWAYVLNEFDFEQGKAKIESKSTKTTKPRNARKKSE